MEASASFAREISPSICCARLLCTVAISAFQTQESEEEKYRNKEKQKGK
jgi:hypothetical protein